MLIVASESTSGGHDRLGTALGDGRWTALVDTSKPDLPAGRCCKTTVSEFLVCILGRKRVGAFSGVVALFIMNTRLVV
jgi:hypothetical protein